MNQLNCEYALYWPGPGVGFLFPSKNPFRSALGIVDFTVDLYPFLGYTPSGVMPKFAKEYLPGSGAST